MLNVPRFIEWKASRGEQPAIKGFKWTFAAKTKLMEIVEIGLVFVNRPYSGTVWKELVNSQVMKFFNLKTILKLNHQTRLYSIGL